MTGSVTVYNAGRPGDTTVEVAARFDRDVTARKPDLVYLLIGGNDMFYPGHILMPERYRENLAQLAERVLGEAKLVLFTIPAFYRPFLIENFPATIDHPLSTTERFERVNAVIRETAERFGVPLIALDELISPVDETAESLVMNEANSGRRDGMHLTERGLQVMAEAAFGVWRRRFAEARSIVCLGDSITYGVYMKGKGTAETDAETYPGKLHRMIGGALKK